jgi:hypothetical protein
MALEAVAFRLPVHPGFNIIFHTSFLSGWNPIFAKTVTMAMVPRGPKFLSQNTKGRKKIRWGRENLGTDFCHD